MRKKVRILAAGCLSAMMLGTMTAHAQVEKTPHSVTLVASQSDYENIAVSQVTDYVNIRTEANTTSSIVGKIYNNCAAAILETVEGEGGSWYRIQSGTVTGFIKAQYFITGEEAENLARSIRREFVTINVDSLRLRELASLDSNTLTLLTKGAEYVVIGEEGDFYKVEIDTDLIGYIAKSYSTARVEFDQAVSLQEEQEKNAEEAKRRQDADDAMAALQQIRTEAPGSSQGGGIIIEANPREANDTYVTAAPKEDTKQAAQTRGGASGTPGSPSGEPAAVVSATRTAIVAYAKQFLGNPYVYGGTSLTNGADCSGFTQSIFSHFGITTGRSSRDQAGNAKTIEVSQVQPGDLLFYGSDSYINHVAIYIGGGQVIHASNERTGIIISPYNYRTPCRAGTFLD